jgi:hypothetical protein
MDGGGREEILYIEGENNRMTNYGLANFLKDISGEM